MRSEVCEFILLLPKPHILESNLSIATQYNTNNCVFANFHEGNQLLVILQNLCAEYIAHKRY